MPMPRATCGVLDAGIFMLRRAAVRSIKQAFQIRTIPYTGSGLEVQGDLPYAFLRAVPSEQPEFFRLPLLSVSSVRCTDQMDNAYCESPKGRAASNRSRWRRRFRMKAWLQLVIIGETLRRQVRFDDLMDEMGLRSSHWEVNGGKEEYFFRTRCAQHASRSPTRRMKRLRTSDFICATLQVRPGHQLPLSSGVEEQYRM
jgi:hypothetical protein